MSTGRVIVVGGGIAGIAAAVRLAERGVEVVLLEATPRLGGRATSYVDPATGEVIDNCQHVVLRCCTNYLDLLERLGVLGMVEWHRRQHWVERGGRVSVIEPKVLPAPGHFTGSVLGARFLSWGEKAALGRAGPAILRANRATLDGETFGAFLKRHGQGARLVERFWNPVVVSACNLSVEKVSAASALHVFQDGFFAHADAATMGVPTVPLARLYGAVEGLLARAGGVVRFGATVAEMEETGVTLTGGEEVTGERVVCALPPDQAVRAMSPRLRERDGRVMAMGRFGFSPILGVHMRFERPAMHLPHAVLVGAGVQWLFRKGETGVHAVISGADEWMGLTTAEIVERVVADVRAYFPGAAGVKLVSARPVKERRATFAPVPGLEAVRPPAVDAGGQSRLVLAGDYTATGWPATMEGATRSGYAAAGAVLGEGGMVVEGLKPGRLARWVVRRPAGA